MTEKEQRAEKLRDELMDFLDTMTEENFDVQSLDAILNELETLDPIPAGTVKSAEESLKEFREKHAHLFTPIETQPPDVIAHMARRK